jgi:hypothetical protein
MPPSTAPIEAPRPDTSARPSWLPAGADLPGQALAAPASPTAEGASGSNQPEYPELAPAAAWTAPQAPPSNRNTILIAGAVGLVLIVGVFGVFAVNQAMSRNSTDTSSNGATTPTTSASPIASPLTPAAPLTGQMSGDYCPVFHPNDAACWKGSFLNTGPAIAKLALIFVVGDGYEDWFAHHANGTLSGFYTTPGCDVEAANSRIVCGSVGAGAQVDVYLGGDVTTRGTFRYAVKFADISSGSPVYVNQHPDGTHDVVSWVEVIT